MADTRQEKLKKEFEDYLTRLLKEASEKFDIVETEDSPFKMDFLKQFHLFSYQQNAHITNSWSIQKNSNNFQLACIEIDSTLKMGRRNETQTHKFLYGLVNTRRDFGISLLTKETLTDKIADLFLKIDIDFETNKSFSKKYRCLSNDTDKFRNAMSDELMNYLSAINHLELEFKKNVCLFRTEKSVIEQKNNLELFSIGIELSKML